MKKYILIVAALALAFTIPTQSQTNSVPLISSTNSKLAIHPPTTIVVTDVTPVVPLPQMMHRIVVPAAIAVTLAPQLLAQIDPQHPSGKAFSRMMIVGNADGSFTAMITYATASSRH